MSWQLPMVDYFYSIYEVNLRLTTDSPVIASAMQTLLGSFQRPLSDAKALEFLFRVVPHRSELVSPPLTAQAISQSNWSTDDALSSALRHKIYRDVDERLLITFADLGYLLIDYRRGRVTGNLIDPAVINPGILTSICHSALIELLKREGLFTLHAAALERDGRGLLIPGHSGQGKTTCCLSLLRAGYRCLSDDHPLLRANGPDLELLPFPTRVHVTEKTIEFFPELSARKEYLHKGEPKQYFYLEDIYPQATAEPCRPVMILFPQIVDCAQTRLEVLPKATAFTELLPHTVFAVNKDITERQFQLLSQLVAQAKCYRLYSGTDILLLPQLLASVCEGI